MPFRKNSCFFARAFSVTGSPKNIPFAGSAALAEEQYSISAQGNPLAGWQLTDSCSKIINP